MAGRRFEGLLGGCLLVLGASCHADPTAQSVVLPPSGDGPPTVTVAEAGAARVVADPCREAKSTPVRVTVGDHEEVWLTRAWMEAAFSTGDVMSSAQIMPVVGGDGGLSALRITGVKAGGTLEELGFREGDEIQSVNGRSILDVQAALDAYTNVRNAARIEVGMLRHGAATMQVLHICEAKAP